MERQITRVKEKEKKNKMELWACRKGKGRKGRKDREKKLKGRKR